jgi:Lipocalin-like domain
MEITAANGTKTQPAGANPKGILIFDAGGRYATVGGRPDRPKYKVASQPTNEEIVAAMQNYFFGNFGTWSVNELHKTLTER